MSCTSTTTSSRHTTCWRGYACGRPSLGCGVTRQWVCRTLHQYGWSFKNATHKQRLKYTAENIECVRARRQRAARTDGGGGARSGLPCGMCTWSSRLPFTGSSTSTKRRLRVAVRRRRRRRRPTRARRRPARARSPQSCGGNVAWRRAARRPAVATNGDSLCEHYSVTIMVGLPPVGQPDAPTVFVNYRADGTADGDHDSNAGRGGGGGGGGGGAPSHAAPICACASCAPPLPAQARASSPHRRWPRARVTHLSPPPPPPHLAVRLASLVVVVVVVAVMVVVVVVAAAAAAIETSGRTLGTAWIAADSFAFAGRRGAAALNRHPTTRPHKPFVSPAAATLVAAAVVAAAVTAAVVDASSHLGRN